MSINQLPESSSAPRRNLLPHKILLALTLALAACDKPHSVQPELAPAEAPAKAPTGAITNTLLETSPELRLDLVQRVIAETLGAGGDFYTRGFARDAGHPSSWHVHQLDVGFGPQRGIHVVTAQKKKGKTYRQEFGDHDKDGNVDFSESSVSWSIKKHDLGTPMTHTQKDNRITPEIQDDYATALKQALVVLKAEKEAKQKNQK